MNTAPVAYETRDALFAAWIDQYGDDVLRTCFLYLKCRETAEDAMQDTFVKAWRAMDSYDGRNHASAKTWIMRIAINTCKDYRRSAWFRHVDMRRALEEIPPSHCAMPQEAWMLLIDVMSLPEKCKQVVLLYHYQNMTLEEAAQILGISRGSVRRRLEKAYALLRCPPEGRDSDEEN